MDPTTHLVVAAIAFLATHYLSSTPLREVLVATLGRAYVALYSLLAFATLGWMIWAFYHAAFVNLWYAVALRPVPLIVMPFALVFLVCGLTTPNPTLVGRERLLKSAQPAHGILRVTRHPMMWGFALWAGEPYRRARRCGGADIFRHLPRARALRHVAHRPAQSGRARRPLATLCRSDVERAVRGDTRRPQQVQTR